MRCNNKELELILSVRVPFSGIYKTNWQIVCTVGWCVWWKCVFDEEDKTPHQSVLIPKGSLFNSVTSHPLIQEVDRFTLCEWKTEKERLRVKRPEAERASCYIQVFCFVVDKIQVGLLIWHSNILHLFSSGSVSYTVWSAFLFWSTVVLDILSFASPLSLLIWAGHDSVDDSR